MRVGTGRVYSLDRFLVYCMRIGRPVFVSILCGISVILGAPRLSADVRLPGLLSDGMVLQQGMKVNIWGTADPAEHFTVRFRGETVSGVADTDGHWKVSLGPLAPGGPFTLTVSGKNTITLHDVLVGEVWVCSGQSNMQMPVSQAMNAQDEIADADYPRLRLFTVEMAVAGKPQQDVKGYWVSARPDTVRDFSAAAYFFGRELLRTLNVPVGLIHSSIGGTPAESWMSHSAVESDPAFKSILDIESKLLSPYPLTLQDVERQFTEWRHSADEAEAEGSPVPPPPSLPDDSRRSTWRPGGLFNGMIMPLAAFTIRGVIWYQGEGNSDRPVQYRKLFPALIRDWRRVWGEGDFPFLYVQIANWGANRPELNWPKLREAQLMALQLPNTGMAVTIDIGDGSDIHPKDKQDVGYRLALAAQAIAYGRDVVYSGPAYEGMSVEGNKIRLRFKFAEDHLIAKGSPPSALNGFEIAGADRKFFAAEAKIEGSTVVVHSEHVEAPVAVRYGWAMNPLCNLYNRAGLPASPFRTDDWDDSFVDKQAMGPVHY